MLGILILLIGLSPILVGAINFPVWVVIWVVAAIFLMGLTSFTSPDSKLKAAAQNLTLVFTTLGITITLFDLLLRLIHPQIIFHRPEERYIRYYPRMPLVVRYRPNLKFEGLAQGELSAIAGDRDYAEMRQIVLYTDPFGFRNTDADPENIDLLILGDSYGVGVGTTETDTWANLLRDDYGLSVYNLSAPASSPWREYLNLAMEIDRLDTGEDTVLLWLIFTGNDLIEDYEDYESNYDLDQLPYRTGISAFLLSWRNFALYSPVGIVTMRMEIAASLSEEQAKPVTVRTFLDDRPILFSNQYLENQSLTTDDIYQHENYPALAESLSRGIDLARAKGLNPVIVLAPTKSEVYEWVLNDDEPWTTAPDPSGFSEVVAELSAQNEVCFLDLKPYLIDMSRQVYEQSGELLYWRDDTHWSESGNAAVAQWVYQNISGGNFCH